MKGNKIVVVVPWTQNIEVATSAGAGAYPFKCPASKRYPTDEVYFFGIGGWASERELEYNHKLGVFQFKGLVIQETEEFKEQYERFIRDGS